MYSEYILRTIPKVLSQIDRDKHSKNYGDCDRNHWHLKTRDFSSAILQQSGLAVALLYLIDFPGNIYYGEERVGEWAEATVRYWQKIQLNDGSFNEYYPNEHGFPPTAFSLYTSCEVYKRLWVERGRNEASIEKTIKKTAHYLSQHIETKALNQEMASITALYSAYTVLNEEWIITSIDNKLTVLLETQSDEGWISEYEGADIGYLSVTLDMMAEYYAMSNDQRVETPLHNIVQFLKYFIHPDGTVGGEYASRNTIYFLPNGLEVLSEIGDKDAEAILQVLFGGQQGKCEFLDGVDDRYCSHYLLHSFIRALERRQKRNSCINPSELPYVHNQTKWFEKAGLLSSTLNNGKIYMIISASKAGTTRIWVDGRQSFSDFGYRVVLPDGSVAATNWWNNDYQYVYEKKEMEEACGHICISGNMIKVGQKVSTPIMHMGLRLVSAVIGNKIISFLKRQIILVNKQSEIKFTRNIEWDEFGITYNDYIDAPKNIIVECADCFSLRHVASGKFYSIADMDMHPKGTSQMGTHFVIKHHYSFIEKNIISEIVVE